MLDISCVSIIKSNSYESFSSSSISITMFGLVLATRFIMWKWRRRRRGWWRQELTGLSDNIHFCVEVAIFLNKTFLDLPFLEMILSFVSLCNRWVLLTCMYQHICFYSTICTHNSSNGLSSVTMFSSSSSLSHNKSCSQY